MNSRLSLFLIYSNWGPLIRKKKSVVLVRAREEALLTEHARLWVGTGSLLEDAQNSLTLPGCRWMPIPAVSPECTRVASWTLRYI